MKKIKIETILDLDNGDYEIKFHKLTPNIDIEWNKIQPILVKIFSSFHKEITENNESTDEVIKIIH